MIQFIKMLIPKGRMFQGVTELLKLAGFDLTKDESSYRPMVNVPGLEIKILKPQNIPKLIESGSYDFGITGYDWVVESKSEVIELLDLGIYLGKIVVAAPKDSKLNLNEFNGSRLLVVSEFENISRNFLESLGINYLFIRSYGATEAFPPEDSDIIVDNTFSGKTLKKNGLEIVDVLLETSARLIAGKQSLIDESKKEKINEITAKIRKVIEGGFNENSY